VSQKTEPAIADGFCILGLDRHGAASNAGPSGAQQSRAMNTDRQDRPAPFDANRSTLDCLARPCRAVHSCAQRRIAKLSRLLLLVFLPLDHDELSERPFARRAEVT
jgi:hypothetical protein